MLILSRITLSLLFFLFFWLQKMIVIADKDRTMNLSSLTLKKGRNIKHMIWHFSLGFEILYDVRIWICGKSNFYQVISNQEMIRQDNNIYPKTSTEISFGAYLSSIVNIIITVIAICVFGTHSFLQCTNLGHTNANSVNQGETNSLLFCNSIAK